MPRRNRKTAAPGSIDSSFWLAEEKRVPVAAKVERHLHLAGGIIVVGRQVATALFCAPRRILGGGGGCGEGSQFRYKLLGN